MEVWKAEIDLRLFQQNVQQKGSVCLLRKTEVEYTEALYLSFSILLFDHGTVFQLEPSALESPPENWKEQTKKLQLEHLQINPRNAFMKFTSKEALV